jgi:CheY-like chemotaxis protein
MRLCPEQGRQTTRPEKVNMSENRPKVLVVDDDPNLTDLLVDTLEVIGYEAVPAGSAQQALSLLGEQQFNLVITDISMPGMSGIELLQEVKRLEADLPVMLITGVGSDELEEEAYQYGADGFLSKPFRIGKIEAEIGKLLKGLHRRRVLLVDDHQEFLSSSKERLEATNNIVTAVDNYQDAVNALENYAFDLVITDLRLPDGDGIELYRMIKRSYQDLPVILVTAYLTPDVLHRIKESGITRFMSKPVDFDTLAETFSILDPVA